MSQQSVQSVCVGMFGTCGGSQWRAPFKEEYLKRGLVENVNFFDPQVPNWTPECAVVEAEHLANDRIILFPITAETYAEGSLAEVGFSILNAIKLDDRRDFVVMIEQKLTDALMQDKDRSKASLRARALIREHLKKLRLDGLYVVDTLSGMLEVSLACYEAQKLMLPYKALNPHRRAW